jgi:2-phosphosulfolactate phosphatase
MHIEVVVLPRDLKPGQLKGRACCVFDVLRATTTMAAALVAGVKEIRLFGDLESARSAAERCADRKLLCGEANCLAPDGFDLGNSPEQFLESHRAATLFMSTTNGTKALLAAREAAIVLTAAIVNARTVATTLRREGRDATLLCAGTNGEIAMEDVLGAGAVISELGDAVVSNDAARMASRLFDCCRDALPNVLRQTQGGQNIITAGLDADIDFAARLNAIDVVGIALGDPLTVRRAD